MMQPAPATSNAVPPAGSRRAAWLAIFVLALVIFGLRVATAVDNPFFNGDAAHRMNNAHLPLVRMGNRIWLPVLQVHIWVFYLLRLPSYAFKIIPAFYFFLAVLLLGLLAYELAGRTRASLIFSLLLMFCFAHQRVVLRLGIDLYQEIIEMALFYLLLWGGALELRKSKWLLPAGGAGLMTRDSFSIYLLAVSLLNRRKIVSDKSYRWSFLFLWSAPLLWFLSIPFGYLFKEGRFPKFLVEWPLGINKESKQAVSDLSTSLGNFLDSMVSSRVLYLAAGLMIVWAIGRKLGVRSTKWNETFYSRFTPFSLLSLGIIYTLIVLFNPWEYTSGSYRMATPALAQAFVWAILLFGDTFSYPAAAKFLARSVLAAAILLGLEWDVGKWVPEDNSQAEACHAEIHRLLEDGAPGRKPLVCIVGEDYFLGLARLIAPTLYARRQFFSGQAKLPGSCELVIAPSQLNYAPGENFVENGSCQLKGTSYAIHRRSNRQ